MTTTPPPVSPLTPQAVHEAMAAAGVVVPSVTCLTSTASTNDVAGQLADEGAAEWTIVSAETQTAGRGRLGRQWEAPTGSALLISVVLRPPSSWAHQLGWIPLLSGLAVADGIRSHGLAAEVKWPNDVVVVESGAETPVRKLSGLLAERRPSAVVVGVGVNVALRRDELPVPAATAMNLEGIDVDRPELLASIVGAWQRRWSTFIECNGDVSRSGIHDEYTRRCISVGREVRVDGAAGVPVFGRVTTIDEQGHLVVETPADGLLQVSAGDVHHLV